VIHFDGRERRARLARRHHLAPEYWARGPLEVARSLVALHSTDPASVYLACLARTGAADVAAVDQALYEDRSLVRMLGMRRTVFVVPVALAPVIDAACTRAIAARQRIRLVQLVEQAGIAAAGDGARWLAQVEEETLAALRERGQAVGQELSSAVPGLREQFSVGDETKKWAAVAAISSRVLFQLAAEGHTVRGRPRGSWTSSQYRWVPRADWLGPAAAPAPAPEAARVSLARSWLATYGPATAGDLKWWTGWTAGETKRALSGLPLVEVDLDGRPALVLADDVEPVAGSESGSGSPWAALLPALDPSVMGWADREWFLGDAEQRALLFDRSGNAGPTVWWDGQVVGSWAQRRDGEIAVRLLRDIGAEGMAAVNEAAERLRQAIGPVRITPRFRTALERELTA
jgi:hypothetical protein